MKFPLALSLLLFSCSCFTTVEGYQTDREFSVKTPELKVNIDYEKELSTGEASSISILYGLLEFGPSSQIRFLWFLSFGRKHEVYGGGDGDSIMSIEGLSNAVIGFIDGSRLEEAAAYQALHPANNSEGAARYHVLGFPLYRSKVTDFLLFKHKKVTVEGFRGKVTSSETSL